MLEPRQMPKLLHTNRGNCKVSKNQARI